MATGSPLLSTDGLPGRLARLGLQTASLALLALLVAKALVDVDGRFDAWWYHLPWAARLAGLVSPDAFLFEPSAAARFEGFPLLPEFLQGWLWRLTGRVESANLVGLGSLVAFILFLRHFFRVPGWLAVPALLAVPLIQAHATSAYVDLIANLAMAALVLLVYLLYTHRDVARGTVFLVIAASAFIAAHSKFQLIPLVALALASCLPPLFGWLRSRTPVPLGTAPLAVRLVAVVLVALAIFSVPLKNLVQHGNPVYPLRLVVLGHVLNGPESILAEKIGGGRLVDAPRPVKWFYSVAEIGMGPVLNVKRWTVDSGAPQGSPLSIQGGLFGAYVGFQLLVFAWLVSRAERRERRAALVLLALTCGVAALMPASHLLRYYMFWFICIIGLNLHFLATRGAEGGRMLFGAACVGFLLVVADATDLNYLRPRFHSAQALVAERVDPKILQELRQSGPACLALDSANQPFLYASIWHPGTSFSIQAGPFFARDRKAIEQVCEGRHLILSRR